MLVECDIHSRHTEDAPAVLLTSIFPSRAAQPSRVHIAEYQAADDRQDESSDDDYLFLTSLGTAGRFSALPWSLVFRSTPSTWRDG